ncbi:MAG TPA: hypothetical protein VEQ10_01295, partial [Vicinamibacteria bacterium]|nr:hypothetical protein [Vicinamibacteria bacterium]
MRLDAWLQEQPLLDERLRFVEQLAIAVDETNRMRQPLGLLEPGRVELTDNLECDLKSARGRVDPTAPYAAPERLEGAPASAESDIYSAGAIAWEVLAGRPCGDPPEHLSTACRDVARELADAIMACLERSPEWRPKDLSYVAELARAGQQTAARTAPRGAARKQAARAAAPSAAAARTAAPRERRAPGPSAPSSRGLYVALAGVLLVGAGGLAFYLLS